jgi:2-methylcitrate dehydratase PrpD
MHSEAFGNKGPGDLIDFLVNVIVRTDFEDIPTTAVQNSKKSILDAFGTTLAGSSAPGVKEVLKLVQYWGGREEATLAVFGHRLPAYHAVLANVMMCHALEIDDSHYPAIVHPTAPTMWAGLATAEQIGGATGREFITAVILGIDAMARIALAAPNTLDNGYHTALYSGFGAAVTAGKLLKLDANTLTDALGNTFAQAAASVQAGSDGALVKRLQPCFNASAGVKAVAFARAGITGIRNVLEGQFGIGRLFNHAPLNREVFLDGLGTHFLASNLTTKRYPTSRCAHGPIEGTLKLVKHHNIQPDDVASVEVAVQESCHKRESKPFDPSEGTPQVKAQFSIDYCVAAAILWRDVFIREIQEECILDPRIQALSSRIRIVRNQDSVSTQYLPVRIRIKTVHGSTFEENVTSLKGSPEFPLSWDEILSERLNRCITYSALPVPQEKIAELIRSCERLECLSDVRELVQLLNFRNND